jgi:hypothetical protein
MTHILYRIVISILILLSLLWLGLTEWPAAAHGEPVAKYHTSHAFSSTPALVAMTYLEHCSTGTEIYPPL